MVFGTTTATTITITITTTTTTTTISTITIATITTTTYKTITITTTTIPTTSTSTTVIHCAPLSSGEHVSSPITLQDSTLEFPESLTLVIVSHLHPGVLPGEALIHLVNYSKMRH